jgi:hypothetical protein
MRYFEQERIDWIIQYVRGMGPKSRLNRGQIMKEFEVSMVQASKDLQTFQRMFPGMIWYDMHEKCYRRVKSHPFDPYVDQTRAGCVFCKICKGVESLAVHQESE